MLAAPDLPTACHHRRACSAHLHRRPNPLPPSHRLLLLLPPNNLNRWVVFYQFAIIATALFHARSEAKFAAVKVRLGMLFAIAIVWVVIQVNAYLPSIVKIQNTLKDAEVKDDNAAVKDSAAGKIYFSGRALGAGYVISAISYFAFIILALGDGDAAPSAKSAAHETA